MINLADREKYLIKFSTHSWLKKKKNFQQSRNKKGTSLAWLWVSNTANFFFNSETLEAFPLKSGQGKAVYNHCFYSSLYQKSQPASKKEKKKKDVKSIQ